MFRLIIHTTISYCVLNFQHINCIVCILRLFCELWTILFTANCTEIATDSWNFSKFCWLFFRVHETLPLLPAASEWSHPGLTLVLQIRINFYSDPDSFVPLYTYLILDLSYTKNFKIFIKKILLQNISLRKKLLVVFFLCKKGTTE